MWELVFMACLVVIVPVCFIFPWAVTGSLVAGVFGFIAFGLCGMLSAIVAALLEVRKSGAGGPRGTYWDGKSWQYGR